MKTFRELVEGAFKQSDQILTTFLAIADELDRRSLETMQISAANDQYRRFRIESHKAKAGDD